MSPGGACRRDADDAGDAPEPRTNHRVLLWVWRRLKPSCDKSYNF